MKDGNWGLVNNDYVLPFDSGPIGFAKLIKHRNNEVLKGCVHDVLLFSFLVS